MENTKAIGIRDFSEKPLLVRSLPKNVIIISSIAIPLISTAAFLGSFLFLKLPYITSKIALLATKISIAEKHISLIIPILISIIFFIGALIVWTFGIIGCNKMLKNKPPLPTSYKATHFTMSGIDIPKDIVLNHIFPYLPTRDLFMLSKVNLDGYSLVKNSDAFRDRVSLLSHELKLIKKGQEVASRDKIIDIDFNSLYSDRIGFRKMFFVFDYENKKYWNFHVITDICEYSFEYLVPGKYIKHLEEEDRQVEYPEGKKKFSFEVRGLNRSSIRRNRWREVIEDCMEEMMVVLGKSRGKVFKIIGYKIVDLYFKGMITQKLSNKIHEYLRNE